MMLCAPWVGVWIMGLPVWLLVVALGPVLAAIRAGTGVQPRAAERMSVQAFAGRRLRLPTVITGFPTVAAELEVGALCALVRDQSTTLVEADPAPAELPATFGGGYWGLKLTYTRLPIADAIAGVFRRRRGAARVIVAPVDPVPAEILVPPRWLEPLLWFQSRGNITPFHYDIREGLVVQLAGRKRFLFSPPVRGLHGLRPFSAYSSPRDFYATRLGLDGDDYYGPVGEVVVYDITIGPGECMYIPSFWWHHVEALDDSVSVTLLRRARASLGHLFLGPRMVWSKLFELRARLSSWRPDGYHDAFDIDVCELFRARKRTRGDARLLARVLHISQDRAADHLKACDIACASEAT